MEQLATGPYYRASPHQPFSTVVAINPSKMVVFPCKGHEHLYEDVHPSPSGQRDSFHASKDLLMDIVIEAGGLRDDKASGYRNRAIRLDFTYADPQAGVHIRAGSTDRDGSAASTSEACNRSQYARPGQASFDERSCKLATFA